MSVMEAPAWEKYAAGTELDAFAEFCEEELIQSEDRWAGEPLVLEGFQRRLMGEALSVDGRDAPSWGSVVIVMPRKNGKTSLLSAYAIYRLFDEGNPEVLFAASSDKQAGKLFSYAANFVRRSETLSQMLRVRDHEGEIVREDGLGKIIRISSDPRRLHGYNPTLVVADELAQWTTPQLERAYAALTSGGAARSAPQVFTITTAGEAHERHASILGRLIDGAVEKGEVEREPGLTIARDFSGKRLVWNYEAPTQDPYDVDAMKLANEASWVTEEYLRKQAENDELTDAQVLQLHGCVWAEAETTFIGPDVIARMWDKTRTLENGATVVLAFDGSERRDETWLTAVTLDGFVWPLARWARPQGAGEEWRIPRREVHTAVKEAFARFDIVEFAPDPPGWYSEIDEWSEKWAGRVVVFETKQPARMAPACERTVTAAVEGELTFGGPLAAELAKQIGQCVRRDTPHGVTVSKDHQDSPRKIDGAVTAIIGCDRAMWHAQNTGPEPWAAF